MSADTDLEELIGHVKRELEILFSLTKRCEMLFEMKQKSVKLPSDYYLQLKDEALDCNLQIMKEEALVCHLLVLGLLPIKEKLREKIVLGAEGLELNDKLAMSQISGHKMYRHNNVKRGDQVRRIGAQGGAQGSRSRDPSRPRGPSRKGCFCCGEEGHLRHECTVEVFCEICKMDNHSSSTCWKKESARRSRSQSRDKGKTHKKKSSKNKKSVKKASTLSSSAENYDKLGEEEEN